MKKMAKCPICPEAHPDECSLATVQRVEGEDTYIYCCGAQEKRESRRKKEP